MGFEAVAAGSSPYLCFYPLLPWECCFPVRGERTIGLGEQWNSGDSIGPPWGWGRRDGSGGALEVEDLSSFSAQAPLG